MNDYYCKNCNNIVGTWYKDNERKYDYILYYYCKFKQSKNCKSIYFLDCENCKKFVGILCDDVCKNCFGEDKIIEEEKLKKWFLKHKKITYNNNLFSCKNCNNKKKFRLQHWFFKELTFYKK